MRKILGTLLCALMLVSVFGAFTAYGAGSVTVYSSHQADVINPLVKEFQERTGITVNVVAAGTGELVKRIQAESQNPLGDVIWGGGAETLAASKDFFQSYKTKENLYLPKSSRDSKYLWTGFTVLPMVIMYNKKLVKDTDVPQGWKDLLKPQFKGQIAMADPARSGSSYTQVCTMLAAFGRDNGKGWKFIEQLIANLNGKILSSSSMVYNGVANGEYAVGLTLEDAASKYIKSGADVGLVYPKEGTSMVPDGMAVIKGTKNLENAKKFIDFMVSKDVQTIIVKTLNRRSVRTDVSPSEGLQETKKIKAVKYDVDWATQNQAEVLGKWKEIVVSNTK